MQRDEAKAILELFRPGSADDQQDPVIAEALRLLESDAELKSWFDEQQALDARIGQVFNAIEPPADLKASILAGMRAHALQSADDGDADTDATLPGRHDKMGAPTTSPAWWRNPWIGIAAVFALLFVIVTIPREDSGTKLAYTDNQALQAGVPAMIQFLADEIDSIKSQKRSFAKQSDQPETLKAYLANAGAPSPADLPSTFRNKASIGCFTLDYDGVKMGMICFKDDQVVHLITVQKSDCPKSFQPKEPTTYEVDNQAFKAWTHQDQVYIISTEGSKEKLPKFI